MRKATRDFFLMTVIMGALLWMFPLLAPWILRQNGELTRVGWGVIAQTGLLAIAGAFAGGLGRVDQGHHRVSDALVVAMLGAMISVLVLTFQAPILILMPFAIAAVFTFPVGVIALLAALVVAGCGWRLVYRVSARSFRSVFRCVARMICNGVPLWAAIIGTLGFVACAICIVCLDTPPVDEIMVILLVAGMTLLMQGGEEHAQTT